MDCDELFFPTSDIAILGIIVNDSNQVLMLKQQVVNEYYVLVAGYYKKGEQLEDTLKREVFEETGIDITNIQYHGNKYYEKKNILMFVYSAKAITTVIRINESEVDSAIWVNLDKAIKLMRPGSIGDIVLKEYINHISN
jgi:NAD+ diphosphatase